MDAAQLTGQDPKSEELAALLSQCSGQRHAVLLQDYPDPDAISCGMAYRLLASTHGIETELLYRGRISHQENLALINLLNIELTRWNQPSFPEGHFQGCVLVDNQGTTTSLAALMALAQVPVIAVIDHHAIQEGEGAFNARFKDLRPVGACATLFVRYLADGLLPLSRTEIRHRHLATALMHGILSDTHSMIWATPLDYAAASFLQPFLDHDMLVRILHQQRSHQVMEVIRLALANRVTRNGFCLAGVGYLRSDDRDAIPQAVDFLVTEDNVHSAVVFGIVVGANGKEVIHGSLRTTKATIAPDAFLKETLGQDEEGDYYGGGRSMSGGFAIPLGFLSGPDDPKLAQIKWEAYKAKIQQKFFQRLGVEDYAS
jgi:nanoRNase/pAp phosphatase (c-di-AMP/oligoRNAs hydrolase)